MKYAVMTVEDGGPVLVDAGWEQVARRHYLRPRKGHHVFYWTDRGTSMQEFTRGSIGNPLLWASNEANEAARALAKDMHVAFVEADAVERVIANLRRQKLEDDKQEDAINRLYDRISGG
jgi:hypothetical protein